MTLARKVALNASALAAGRLVLMVTGVVSVGVATRYLGINSYGSLTTAVAFAGLLMPLVDLGLGTIGAREIARRPNDTEKIVGSMLGLGLVLAVVALALGVITAQILYPGDENELVRQGILLLLIILPLSAPVNAVFAYFLAQQRAYIGTIATLCGSALTLALLVAATQLDWGFTGVAIAYVATAVGYGACVFAFAFRKLRIRLHLDFRMWAELARWAAPVGAFLIVLGVYWKVNVIVLSLFSTKDEVAVYGLAFKVIEGLLVLPYYVAITLLPEIARLQDERARLNELMQKAFTVMQFCAAPLVVVFAAFAPEIVDVVAGDEFAAAARVLQLLMVGVALTYLGAIFNEALIALDRQATILYVGGAMLATCVALALLLVPLLGARGAALAYIGGEIVGLAGKLIAYRRVAPLPRLQRPAAMLAAAAAAVAVAIALKFAPGADGASPLLVAGLGGFACVVAYGGVLYHYCAVPQEVYTTFVTPIWSRLRPHLSR